MKGYGETIYPAGFPKVKDANFNFYNFTIASQSAIQQASWSALTINDIYEGSVNWWKKK